MNLLLFERTEREGDRVVLQGRRAEHILDILRLGPGDRLRVGELDGNRGSGRVVAVDDRAVTLEVELNQPPPPGPGVDLVLALPRPIMLQRILKQATVLGVDRFFLIRSRRVEKSFFHSPVLDPARMRQLLVEGLEQAMDTRLPGVSVHHRFKPFVEDVLPTVTGRGLLAHPGTTTTLGDLVLQEAKFGEKIILAVGPEGGWSAYECERFEEAGFSMFSMGERILHVDTAVVALLAQLHLLRGLAM